MGGLRKTCGNAVVAASGLALVQLGVGTQGLLVKRSVSSGADGGINRLPVPKTLAFNARRKEKVPLKERPGSSPGTGMGPRVDVAGEYVASLEKKLEIAQSENKAWEDEVERMNAALRKLVSSNVYGELQTCQAKLEEGRKDTLFVWSEFKKEERRSQKLSDMLQGAEIQIATLNSLNQHLQKELDTCKRHDAARAQNVAMFKKVREQYKSVKDQEKAPNEAI